MIGHREGRARTRIEDVEAELLAHGNHPVLAQHAVDVHGRRDVDDPVLREHHHPCASLLVELDEVPGHIIGGAKIALHFRHVRPDLLQVVVEVRQIDERQRGVVLPLDAFRRFGDPARGVDRRARAPELEQRERPELRLQLIPQRSGRGVDVRYLPAVGRVHRPRRDGVVRRRIHVEPPEQVRARERRIGRAGGVPDLRRVHQPVRLLPEPDLAILAGVPAVADNAMGVGILAGEVIGLGRARDGREGRLDARQGGLPRPRRQLRATSPGVATRGVATRGRCPGACP